MKTFYAAVVIFLLLIALMIFNYVGVTRTADEMIGLCKLENKNDIKALSDAWSSKKSLLRLSIGRKKVNDISDLITSLDAAYGSGNVSRAAELSALLISSFEELAAFERFSLCDIF